MIARTSRSWESRTRQSRCMPTSLNRCSRLWPWPESACCWPMVLGRTEETPLFVAARCLVFGRPVCLDPSTYQSNQECALRALNISRYVEAVTEGGTLTVSEALVNRRRSLEAAYAAQVRLKVLLRD